MTRAFWLNASRCIPRSGSSSCQHIQIWILWPTFSSPPSQAPICSPGGFRCIDSRYPNVSRVFFEASCGLTGASALYWGQHECQLSTNHVTMELWAQQRTWFPCCRHCSQSVPGSSCSKHTFVPGRIWEMSLFPHCCFLVHLQTEVCCCHGYSCWLQLRSQIKGLEVRVELVLDTGSTYPSDLPNSNWTQAGEPLFPWR